MSDLPHILKENLEESEKWADRLHHPLATIPQEPRQAVINDVKSHITSLIIKVAEGEIERLEKLKTVRHFWDGWFLVEDDTEGCIEKNKVYNQAIQDQISYWTSVKEEIIKNK